MTAFPNIQLTVSEMGQVRAINEVNVGMDLRDYFAAKALPVLYKLFSEFEDGFVSIEVANAAYEMADAMMRAREVKNG